MRVLTPPSKIESGVFRESLIMKSFITLEGEGIGKTIIHGSVNVPVIRAYNLSDCRIKKLSISFETVSIQPVLYIRYSNLGIFDCELTRGRRGVDVAYNSSINMVRCSVQRNSDEGVLAAHRTQLALRESVVTSNGGNGVTVDDESGQVIEHNRIYENAGDGLAVSNRSNCVIRGNYIFDNGRSGIVVSTGSNPILRNNTILKHKHPSGAGILIFSTETIPIINNILAYNAIGLKVDKSRDLKLEFNSYWLNGRPRNGIGKGSSEIELSPLFVDSARSDFNLKAESKLRGRGYEGISIGADFDYDLTVRNERKKYLLEQAQREFARQNWRAAYKSTGEILSLDKHDLEGAAIHEKAGRELAKGYVEKARVELESHNLTHANNYLRTAFSYDHDNEAAVALKDLVDAESRQNQLVSWSWILGIGGAIAGFGFLLRRRVQIGEMRRHALWWLTDAEEQMILVQNMNGHKLMVAEYDQASKKMDQAREALEQRQFDKCETLSNEVLHLATVIREKADRDRQTRKDAFIDVSRAEDKLNEMAQNNFADYYPEEFKEFGFYLQRAKEALKNKQFQFALELSADILNSIDELLGSWNSDKEQEIHHLISVTENSIIKALAVLQDPDLVEAIIQFKDELKILKIGIRCGAAGFK